MTEATNIIRYRRPMRTLVFELAFAVSLCVWIVTMMAWALS
jgi:hypothetical protein